MDNSKCWLKDSCNHCKCDTFCDRHFKLNYLYNYAYIPVNKRVHQVLTIDADNTDEKEFITLSNIENNILDFVLKGQSLFLHSTQCGNGKTSWAYRMVQSYFHKIWYKSELKCRAIFINVPKFLIALKDDISNKSEYIQDIKENMETADLIIWDDIGTKLMTTYEAEHLLTYIETRINAGKANIFTSNLNNDEVKKLLGDRLASRINNSTYNIELHGKDKRGL